MNKLDIIDGLTEILSRKHEISLLDAQSLRRSFNERDDLTFEDFLLEEGIVDRDDLLQALSEYYNVPANDVTGVFFDHYLLRLMPKDVMLEHFMIPYQREGDNLWVVASQPNDPHLLVVLGKYLSHNINFMVGLPQDILDAIEEYYDESDTYQPNDISNQQMERSAPDIHPTGQEDERIPELVDENVDDYERH